MLLSHSLILEPLPSPNREANNLFSTLAEQLYWPIIGNSVATFFTLWSLSVCLSISSHYILSSASKWISSWRTLSAVHLLVVLVRMDSPASDRSTRPYWAIGSWMTEFFFSYGDGRLLLRRFDLRPSDETAKWTSAGLTLWHGGPRWRFTDHAQLIVGFRDQWCPADLIHALCAYQLARALSCSKLAQSQVGVETWQSSILYFRATSLRNASSRFWEVCCRVRHILLVEKTNDDTLERQIIQSVLETVSRWIGNNSLLPTDG